MSDQDEDQDERRVIALVLGVAVVLAIAVSLLTGFLGFSQSTGTKGTVPAASVPVVSPSATAPPGGGRPRVATRPLPGHQWTMDLIDDSPAPSGNQPEYTVSELSGAVKRVIEGEFGMLRVRGEVGRVSRPASGHLYFDLKDDRSVIAAISWKGQVAKMQVRPEEGMEVVATGRMTTFPGQSKYQLIVEDVAPAGAGALMAMLEKRRAALAACEGRPLRCRTRPTRQRPDLTIPTRSHVSGCARSGCGRNSQPWKPGWLTPGTCSSKSPGRARGDSGSHSAGSGDGSRAGAPSIPSR